MLVELIGDWKLLAVRGAAAVLFGLGALVWPGPTVLALVLLFGAYLVVDGISILAAVMTGAPETRDRRGVLVFEGIVSVLLGILTFIWPDITAVALLWVIAAWALVTGVLEIFAAVRLRRVLEREWILGLIGALSIVFAIILVVDPGAGALGITWAIAWYALVSGSLYLALAWKVRKLQVGETRPGVPAGDQPRPLAT